MAALGAASLLNFRGRPRRLLVAAPYSLFVEAVYVNALVGFCAGVISKDRPYRGSYAVLGG
jgi:hypothetical protein